jgi:hypothetical protein
MSESAINPLRQLRLTVAAVALPMPLLLGVLALIGLLWKNVDTLWFALPAILGAANFVLLPAVGSTVRPLPYSAPEEDARRVSMGALRTITFLRLALGEMPALFGLALSLTTGSLWPYAVGFFFAFPQLLWFAYPRAAILDDIRTKLEASGAKSGL